MINADKYKGHTPGPWRVDPKFPGDVQGPDGLDLAVTLCKPMDKLLITTATVGVETRAEAGINAVLIADAPMLLGKLIRLSKAATALAFVLDNDVSDEQSLAAYDELVAALEEAEKES